MGRDKGKKPLQLICLAFQSTLPAWGETRYRCRFWQLAKYFNPLSPHGERLGAGGVAQNNAFISIHSPRMGRDLVYIHYIITAFRFQSTLPAWGETEMLMQRHIAEYISIHSPRMGRDPATVALTCTFVLFQSTLPAWGETVYRLRRGARRRISIHSPRMGRDGAVLGCMVGQAISIHSPRMGRDNVFLYIT